LLFFERSQAFQLYVANRYPDETPEIQLFLKVAIGVIDYCFVDKKILFCDKNYRNFE
jgi:hypothetical protein